MNPDDFARHGSSLLEQVQQQVDAPRGLERLRRGRRNTRVVAVAFAAAAILIFVLFGGLWWLSAEVPPADQPTTTTLRALPVEVSIVLLDEFVVDSETGTCSGDGVLDAFTASAAVSLAKPTQGDTLDGSNDGTVIATLVLPAGTVISDGDVVTLGGSAVAPDACRFTLPETGLVIHDFRSSDVDIEVVLDATQASLIATSGQRHTYFYGGDQ